jgi:hypothetical protein
VIQEGLVSLFSKAVSIAALLLTSNAQNGKQFKNQGEYDLYNEVVKDAANADKQLRDLDAWTAKYPESDYKDDRWMFYLSAYNGANQPGKVLDTAAQLLARDLRAAFPDPRQVISILYLATLNVQKLVNPSPQQVAAGQRAAHDLLEFLPGYFTAERKPADTGESDWAKAHGDLELLATTALANIAMQPGNRALATDPKNPANCAAAEIAYTKALQEYRFSAQIAYALAGALRCQQSKSPEKVPLAIYEYARAAVLEPGKGGIADAKARQDIETYLHGIYVSYHGSDEGLEQLKQLAARLPTPPEHFKIQTGSEVDAEKQADFAKSNPQLALWAGIRRQLTDADGEKYFETDLKGAAVPKLRGKLVEGKPECRSKQLLVAISSGNQPEVALKLAAPLPGKPEAGAEIQWEGVPSAFSKEPFLLTMDTEKAKVENLRVSPCAAARRTGQK